MLSFNYFFICLVGRVYTPKLNVKKLNFEMNGFEPIITRIKNKCLTIRRHFTITSYIDLKGLEPLTRPL